MVRYPLHDAIEKHWRAHRPNMVKALESKGLLARAVNYAAKRTAEAESSLIQQGLPAMQAQELMRQEWAFLPSEEDQPELPNGGPERWLSAPTTSSRPASTSPPAASERG